MIEETKKRSIAKTISFRVIATIITFILVLLFTKDFQVAFSVGLVDASTKTIIYYYHERWWDHVHWGYFNNGKNDRKKK